VLGLVAHVAGTIVLIVSALFPIVNPLGSAPIFLAYTRGATPAERRSIALRVGSNSFILMLASMAIGSYVLRFFGISLPIVQVGGGLLVFAAGWNMFKHEEKDYANRATGDDSATHLMRKAFYPLTLPLTVGPGSIATAITLGANLPPPGGGRLLLSLLAGSIGTFIVATTVFLSYAFAGRIARIIGPAGVGVVLRLSAFLLVCIGLQIVWNGITALVHGL